MADCLEDPHLGDDIIVANHEYDKNMKSIETGAFHEGFDRSNEPALQKSFNFGYERIFEPFAIVSQLDGIVVCISHYLRQQNVSPDIDQVRSQILELQNKMFGEFENASAEDRVAKDDSLEPHQNLSEEVKQLLDTIKDNLKELVKSNKLDKLVPLIDQINL